MLLLAQSQTLADSAYALMEREAYPDAAQILITAAKQESQVEKAAEYLLDAGDAFRAAKEPDQALLVYKQLIDYPSGSKTVDSLRALAYHLTGLLQYKAEEYSLAITAYQNAIEIRDRLYPKGHNDAAKSRYNLGNTFLITDDLKSAERSYQQSNQIYEQIAQPDTMRWLRTLRQLAICYNQLKDGQLVRGVVTRAIPLVRRHYQANTLRLGYWYYNLGANLSNVGSADLMSSLMDSAIYYYQLADAPYEVLESVHTQATAKMEALDFVAARSNLIKVVDQLDDFELEDPLRNAAYFNAAITSMELNEFRRAEREGIAALSGFTEAGDSLGMAQVLHLLARNSSKAGQAKQANTYFENAFNSLLGTSLDRLSVGQIPSSNLLLMADILTDRAAEWTRQQSPKLALADYNLSFTVLDRIRKELSNEESQNWISANIRPIFQRAILLHYQLYQQSGNKEHVWAALELSERSKAFSLLMASRQLGFERPRQERELRRKIAKLERSSKAKDQAELGKLRIELERLLNLNAPAEVELPTFDRQALLKWLNEQDQTLVEFALGQPASYIFVISPDGTLRMEELVDEVSLTKQVRSLRETIESSAFKRKSLNSQQAALDDAFKKVNLALGSAIWGKAAKTVLSARQLIIVPDGVLGFLPFGTLLTKDPGASPLDYKKLPYLQLQKQLTFGYSALYLLDLSKRSSSQASNNLLAFAPTFFGGQSVSQAAQSRALQRTDEQRSFPALLPLRFNEEEVNRVSSLIPRTDAFLGADATRQEFERSAADYRMLLISSHAFVDAADPNQSFIAFSQHGDSLETDEMLYLNDLGTLQLPVDLAVLSACETSMGKVVPGEGVLSLARAFAAAGAASTLTTLWKVDDEATKQLTVDFFTALNEGRSRSDAVAYAQVAAINSQDFAHPYYWSAMTLYGDGRGIDIQPGFALNRGFIYVLIFLALLMLIFVLLKRSRTQS